MDFKHIRIHVIQIIVLFSRNPSIEKPIKLNEHLIKTNSQLYALSIYLTTH